MGSPPWVRAPFLLFTFPTLLLAIATSVGILAIASASSPAFLSAAGNRAFQDGMAPFCPYTATAQITSYIPLVGRVALGSGSQRIAATDASVQHAITGIANLDPVVHTILGGPLSASKTGAPSAFHQVRLVERDGALDHVQKLQSAEGSGVWITDTSAAAMKVKAGDSIKLDSGAGQATVRVAGLYHDVGSGPLPQFWCSLGVAINGYPNSNIPPPRLVLADRDLFLQLGTALRDSGDQFIWEYPLHTQGLTLHDAGDTAARLFGIQQALETTGPQFFGSVTLASVSSPQLPGVVRLANETVDALRGSVQAISLAGWIVALLVLGAAGIYWVDRRRSEVAVLSAKGAGSAAIMVKVVLEALPVAIVAAGLGWYAAIAMVRAVGPTRLLDPSVPGQALRQVVWTGAIGLLLMAATAAASARRLTELGPVRGAQTLSRAPWEAAVLLLAAASLYEILTRGTAPIASGSGGPAKVDVLLLLFPILFVAGLAGLASRGLRRLLPRLRSAGSRWPPAMYLTSRRLAGASRTALALVTASALAIGILAYAGFLTASAKATARAKAEVFLGSDVAVTLVRDQPIPAGLQATKVESVDGIIYYPDQVPVKALIVNPRTLPAGAFWDGSFGASSLPSLLRKLEGPLGDTAPILAVGPLKPEGGLALGAGTQAPVRIVASLKAFPGESPNEPLIVLSQDAASRFGLTGPVQLWARGDPAAITRTIRRSGLDTLSVATIDSVQATSDFRAVSWALGFLQALGIMTGAIALGGVLLYLEARQRAREISYALSRRMGLTRRAHAVSVTLELGGMLLIAWLLGVFLAGVAARILYLKLDPLPDFPPPALYRVPLPLIGLIALALLVVAAVGAWRVQRAADRARVAEVMRLAA